MPVDDHVDAVCKPIIVRIRFWKKYVLEMAASTTVLRRFSCPFGSAALVDAHCGTDNVGVPVAGQRLHDVRRPEFTHPLRYAFLPLLDRVALPGSRRVTFHVAGPDYRCCRPAECLSRRAARTAGSSPSVRRHAPRRQPEELMLEATSTCC